MCWIILLNTTSVNISIYIAGKCLLPQHINHFCLLKIPIFQSLPIIQRLNRPIPIFSKNRYLKPESKLPVPALKSLTCWCRSVLFFFKIIATFCFVSNLKITNNNAYMLNANMIQTNINHNLVKKWLKKFKG